MTTIRDLRSMAWPGAVVLSVLILVCGGLIYGCATKSANLQSKCITAHGSWSDGGTFGKCTFPKAAP
jgi:hypothetical protein